MDKTISILAIFAVSVGCTAVEAETDSDLLTALRATTFVSFEQVLCCESQPNASSHYETQIECDPDGTRLPRMHVTLGSPFSSAVQVCARPEKEPGYIFGPDDNVQICANDGNDVMNVPVAVTCLPCDDPEFGCANPDAQWESEYNFLHINGTYTAEGYVCNGVIQEFDDARYNWIPGGSSSWQTEYELDDSPPPTPVCEDDWPCSDDICVSPVDSESAACSSVLVCDTQGADSVQTMSDACTTVAGGDQCTVTDLSLQNDISMCCNAQADPPFAEDGHCVPDEDGDCSDKVAAGITYESLAYCDPCDPLFEPNIPGGTFQNGQSGWEAVGNENFCKGSPSLPGTGFTCSTPQMAGAWSVFYHCGGTLRDVDDGSAVWNDGIKKFSSGAGELDYCN